MSTTTPAIEIWTAWEFIVTTLQTGTSNELHLPLLSISQIMILGFGVLVSRGFTVCSPHSAHLFTFSLTTCMVSTTLSPMLHMAGTTVCSRRKLFNRPWSICTFSSSPLEAARSHTHTVTDGFHGYWVYCSSCPPWSRPVARLQLQSTPLAGTLLPLRTTGDLLNGHTSWLPSVVVLHCPSSRCQRIGFFSNVLQVEARYQVEVRHTQVRVTHG